jgi:hypothetical protein
MGLGSTGGSKGKKTDPNCKICDGLSSIAARAGERGGDAGHEFQHRSLVPLDLKSRSEMAF